MPANAAWTFLHATDSHLGSPRSYRYNPAIDFRWQAIKRQMIGTGADLLLHGGDLTRDGESHEQELVTARNDLMSLPFPTHAIPGNMDVGNKSARRDSIHREDTRFNVTSKGLNAFARHLGPVNWSFVYRDIRFTGFYAAVTGSGLPEEQAFWDFLVAVAASPRVARHVVVMHYWLFIESPDENDWAIEDPDQYHNWYFSINRESRLRIFDWMRDTGVEIVFSGHVHTGRSVQEYEGICFFRASSAGHVAQLAERWPDAEPRQGFHRCDVTGDHLEVVFVPCDPVALEQADSLNASQYGPGGHPLPDERDYGAAKQQPAFSPSTSLP